MDEAAPLPTTDDHALLSTQRWRRRLALWTAAVISMELTDNHDFVLPIMAVCLLGRTFSSLLCPTPVYRALARQLTLAREKELHGASP